MEYRVLVCEDEENILSFLTAELAHEGYMVDTATDGELGLQLFSENDYHIVLLDLMLPKKNGLSVLHEIRKKSAVPVIMVTARKDVYDKVSLLDAGADDYVTKPFDTSELLARIRRHIKRVTAHNISTEGDLIINSDSYEASVNENNLSLTKTEFEILSHLMQNKNKVQTREQIIHRVYGNYYGDSNVVDVNIKNIRNKISEFSDDVYIATVRGKGYVIRSGRQDDSK